MLFYIYLLVKPLFLPNTSITLSTISYQLSASLSAIRYFYQAEPY